MAPFSTALAIHDLQKTYAGGVQALRGVDLKVSTGDFFGLLGPNGAGKTTIIGAITSLVRPDSGELFVFGYDARKDPARARRLIGVVPQEFNFNIFETPLQIVLNQAGYYGISRREAKASAEELLNRLGLWSKRDAGAGQLSGGMKRGLMIARALVHQPRLLLLDEPTAGVDIELRRSMWEFLNELNAAGVTIILTTHYLEEAEQMCRRVAIIDQGRIVEDTSVAELIQRLHTEAFVLDLSAAISTPPADSPFALKLREDGRLEAELSREQSVNDLFAWLSAQGIRVSSLRNRSNRLEELFLKLTSAGRKQ